jgi:D-xylose transport system permease protein
MSTATPAEIKVMSEEEGDGLAAIARRRWIAFKSGDVGSLPVIVFLVAVTIFFTSKSSVFFTAVNFDNLLVQMAGLTTIAIGVVFVLLLGEIDLSIGFVSGVGGVIVAELQQAGTNHNIGGFGAIVLALVAGALIGALQGSFVAFIGVPSFVVTLAGLLVWEGVIIRALGTQGVIGIQSNLVNNVANYYFSDTAGWIIAFVIALGSVASAVGTAWTRRRAGLPVGNLILIVARIIFVAGGAFLVVAICNHSRGVPFAGLLLIALIGVFSYLATRLTFGRHVYAVGGNAEAARRAGINVAFIRIAVFMISGLMAALGGIIFAARLSSVDLSAGGGTILLDAIAAAVIGGTSLFGGRGYVRSALYGGLIIATISNGIDLVGYSDATKDITTGLILLAAVTLDTVSRRRLQKAGR